MAPDLTFARQAATYHAGIFTQSYAREDVEANDQTMKSATYFEPSDNGRTVPGGKRSTTLDGLLEKFLSRDEHRDENGFDGVRDALLLSQTSIEFRATEAGQ